MASKHVVRALAVCCAGLVSMGIASAQAKIGIVDFQKALVETAEIKLAQQNMEAKYKPRLAEMEKLQKELQDLQAQIQGGKLNPAAEQEARGRGQRRQRELERMNQDMQEEQQKDREEILVKSGQRMKDVIKKIAEERGLDVVLDVTNTVYSKNGLEITPEATAAFDKAYPVK